MSDQPQAMAPDSAESLLRLARESIRSHFAHAPLPRPSPADAALERSGGAFVTLKAQGGRLRGCIGRVESAAPLWETVARMARASAFEDPRFPPLEPEELDDVSIEVSLMTPVTRVDSPEAVVAGVHGVMVEHGARRGLFLPQVAREQGWDRDELLDEVCRKAGLPAGSWRDPDVAIYVFRAEVIAEPA